ncbi:Zein-binding domain [Macleaya cordata]|uniref:Zein-binding domain n=1 Tax=Macleaya cordata TaxID=56857 RepID=A0A200PYJ6_MACCD|nr:Zein-binding domain [Macleaya cordata]
MASESVSFPSNNWAKCCSCSCSCSLINSESSTWHRSVKRKYEQVQGFSLNVPTASFDYFSIARVEVENECVALREAVSSQQKTIQELYIELEEERNASSSAANEAMSMILRLQREKAEIQMEARQFKRFAEEKMAHDQQELIELDDLLYKREEAIQSLSYEVQVYKHRMLSFGFTEAEVEGEKCDYSQNENQNMAEKGDYSPNENQDMVEKCDIVQNQNQNMVENYEAEYEFPPYDYPPLKCNLNETQSPRDSDITDIEKYPFGETPRTAFGDTPRARELQDLEHRIYQLERTPSSNHIDGQFPATKNTLEKSVLRQSPRRSRHARRFSVDSTGSLLGSIKETEQDCRMENPRASFKKMEYFSHPEEYSNSRKVDNASDFGDEMSDRVYTIDSVHHRPYNSFAEPKPAIGVCEDYVTTPRESLCRADIGDPDIKKLYMRLQALEADRESMKQAIISMRTDKAQLILLKEIAQNLCKEMSPERRTSVKKPSLIGKFSLMSALKVILDIIT